MGLNNPSQVNMHTDEDLVLDLSSVYYQYLTGFNLLTDGSKSAVSQANLRAESADPTILKEVVGASGSNLITFRPTGKLGMTTIVVTSVETTPEGTRKNFVAIPVRVQYQKVLKGDDSESDGASPMLAAGKGHSIALTASGEVYVWGCNQYGQLGMEPVVAGETAQADADTFNEIFVADGAVPVTTPTRVLDGMTYQGKEVFFTAVAAGDYFSLALDNFGRVWAAGMSEQGQLGRNARYVSLMETQDHPYIPGETVEVEVGRRYYMPNWDLVVMEEKDASSGEPLVLGTNKVGKSYPGGQYVLEPDPVVAIAAGKNHAMALTLAGYVYAWGDNSRGQLGINRDVSGLDPKDPDTDLSDYYALVARTVTKGASPSNSARMDNIIRIAAGGNNSFAVRHNGALYGWGENDQKQVGADSNDPIRVAPTQSSGDAENNDLARLDQIIDVAAGDNHGVALRFNTDFATGIGVLYGWGSNTVNQVSPTTAPNGVTIYAPTRMSPDGSSVRQIAAGHNGTLALTEMLGDRQLLAYGDNTNGRLGVVGAADTKVARAAVHHDGTVNHGNYDYMQAVDVFAVGGRHVLVSRDTGFVYAAGENDCGQIGDNTNETRIIPVQVGERTVVTLEAGGWVGNYPNYSGAASNLGTEQEVKAESQYIAIDLRHVGISKLFGLNLLDFQNAQNGNPGDFEVVSLDETMLAEDPAMVGHSHLKVFCSPNRTNPSEIKYGETYLMIRHIPTGATLMLRVLMRPENGDYVEPRVSVAANHTVALKCDGTVWAWGDNSHGQLGDGTFQERAYPVRVTYPEEQNGTTIYKEITGAIAVAAGDTFTLVLVNGKVLVLGDLENVTVFDDSALLNHVPGTTFRSDVDGVGNVNLAQPVGGTYRYLDYNAEDGKTNLYTSGDGKTTIAYGRVGDTNRYIPVQYLNGGAEIESPVNTYYYELYRNGTSNNFDVGLAIWKHNPVTCPECGSTNIHVWEQTVNTLKIKEEDNIESNLTLTPNENNEYSYLDASDPNGIARVFYAKDQNYIPVGNRLERYIPKDYLDNGTEKESPVDTSYYVLYLTSSGEFIVMLGVWAPVPMKVPTSKWQCDAMGCGLIWDPTAPIPYCQHCKQINYNFRLIYDDAKDMYASTTFKDMADWQNGVNNATLEYRYYKCNNPGCQEVTIWEYPSTAKWLFLRYSSHRLSIRPSGRESVAIHNAPLLLVVGRTVWSIVP